MRKPADPPPPPDPDDPRLQPDTTAAYLEPAPGVEARPDRGRWANRGVAPLANQGTVWVVVADEAIARILSAAAPGVLEHVETLKDPDAHAKEGELHVHDAGRRAGRLSHDGGQPTRVGAGGASLTRSAGDEEKHLEARDFARHVAEHLAAALQQKRYDKLRIVAAPRFLGKLREELDPAVKAAVVEEVLKDLVRASDHEIAQRLFPPPKTS
ncbi:MAG TPA: host attachment protein [Caldimonas sp.]|jgi:protein required for attachment to host cells|nr:host attachment protein [Caldimonas sp.]